MPNHGDITKQVWKFQEGLVYLALTECSASPENIHWNYEKVSGSNKKAFTPAAMSIDPDIVVGDKESPEALVFVTHATMERGSEKKFWRTVAEVIEEKGLPSHPKVYSVLYSGNVKPSLMEAYTYLFDGVYHLDQTDYGDDISKDLIELTRIHGHEDPLVCFSLLKTYKDKHPERYLAYYNNIKQMYNQEYGPKHALLVDIAMNENAIVPQAHITSLRRSACKLATLPEEIRRELLSGNNKLEIVPKHTVLLGWFEKVIGGYRLRDQELLECIRTTDIETIEYVCEKISSIDKMAADIANLNSVDNRSAINTWIIDHYDALCNDETMFEFINNVFYDASYGLNEYALRAYPSNHWLFESIMSMLRTETGRTDGYGYSALAIDAGQSTGITGGYIYVADLLNRKNQIDLSINKKIAVAFSKHLRRIGKSTAKQLLYDSIRTLCTTLFNYNIETYRYYNPMEWLVVRMLSESGIPFTYPSTHASFLSDDIGGAATSTNNIICVNGGSTWIKCQSAYDGKTDKRKELCGRIGAMKLKYPSEKLKDKRFCLVIDGYFDQEDITLLSKAGWDGIFYPDEMDKLKAAIL